MLCLWNLYLLLPLSLPLSLHGTEETPQGDTAQPSQRSYQPSLTPRIPLFVLKSIDSSSEEIDRQGVIGEYADTQESSETSLLFLNKKVLVITGPTQSATDVPGSKGSSRITESSPGFPSQTSQEQALVYKAADSSVSILHPQTEARQNETTDSQLHFPFSGSLPPESPDLETTVGLSAGSEPNPQHPTLLFTIDSQGETIGSRSTTGQIKEGTILLKDTGDGLNDVTDCILLQEDVSIQRDKDGLREDSLQVSKVGSRPSLDGNMDTSASPCKNNQSWTPIYPDDLTPNEPLLPSLALSPPLFVPLYPDWNSALATWGLAWEAHIYGLGSVFIVFGLISVVGLLGLPLRCPPGAPYFTLLHLFLMAFTGTQAFFLLYDAYNHQDRLPPVCSLLLSELPLPCLITAFSLAFHLLSLRSRMRLSLPLAISTSFSVLPRPSLLLCVCLVHFGVSLGCVGLLQLTRNLPVFIIVFPQASFVCLSIFLSCAYLIFYCFIRVDTKHIYRLNDSEENGGSPGVTPPARCPFVKVEDWGRAAGAGIAASLFLLGCGGLQLYGILHALGLGGVDGFGFQPWPWWSYQVGCRLCEVGVCLCLSLIGAYPIFCQGNTIRTITHPRPGSWSRLTSSSPSQGVNLPSQGSLHSPVLSSHYSWSQGKQEKIVVCEIISKGHTQDLPLSSMTEPPRKGIDFVFNSKQTRAHILPLPIPPSPPHKQKSQLECQLSPQDSLGLETDSTGDLRPPSPIDLSRSIDQALFSESLFSHSLFGLPRLPHASSSHSLTSPSQITSKQCPSSVEDVLYRTSSCGDVDQENGSRPSQPCGSLSCHKKQPTSPEQWDSVGSNSGLLCRASLSSSSQGLCCNIRETGKMRSHPWAHKGQNFAPSSLPRAIPHLPYHRRYRTLSAASQDKQESGRLAATKQLSESKQLEWDLAVQAEFVSVCRQIDALSVCSDTIEL
ncbi:proline-rich transmembrane protein 4 [Genypterus blacodes]|uniref:proline-rich transmembrane protein 4 n=1 Tax=Genypterus blacodes TaxID=154954 RepID=UPI003F770167